jgi:hypothetical protein
MLDVFPKYIGYLSYRTYSGPCCTWHQDCEPGRYLNCTFGRNFVYHGEHGDLWVCSGIDNLMDVKEPRGA